MPRKPRQKSATDVYHVMTRGLNKMAIYKGKREKTRIVNLIRENLSAYDVAIYAYCIMPNHMHLLLKADVNELASFMAKILATFAHYFNTLHTRIGYVYQDRFKSQCVTTDQYFWNCVRYIHRNPARQGTVQDMLKYNYSSLGELHMGIPDLVCREMFLTVLDRFGDMDHFLDFHRDQSRDVFCDVEEELNENYERIAEEILTEYSNRYNIPKDELLSYSLLRKEFESEVKKTLCISRRNISCIEATIKEKQNGTG